MSFANLLDPLLKITQTSAKMSNALTKSDFVNRLVEKLNHANPLVRLNLLKILNSLWDSADAEGRKKLTSTKKVLKALKEDKQSVLVQQLAVRLLKMFKN